MEAGFQRARGAVLRQMIALSCLLCFVAVPAAAQDKTKLAVLDLRDKGAGPDLAAMNVVMALLYGLGSTIGPSLLGLAMSAWPPHGLMAAMAAACVAVAGFALTRKPS